MASRRAAILAKHLFNGFKASLELPRQTAGLTRSLTTTGEPTLPNATLSQTYIDANLSSASTEPMLKDDVARIAAETSHTTLSNSNNLRPHFAKTPKNPFLTTATCTLHAFPSLEPVSFTTYPSTHLRVPLRRDILHRATIYEADATRQGTANTKWRSEVHGSNRKIRPQKGTGSARLGNKKSPMLKGGGKAFGPKPRDFSTELPRKIYDLAWRTALSWRWRSGGLVVVEGEVEVNVAEFSRERYVRDLLDWHNFGRAGGRTLFVAQERREGLFAALEGREMGRQGRALEVKDVDVKDLLELGRVVVERGALERMLREHEGDLRDVERLVHFRRGYGVVRDEVQQGKGLSVI